MRELSSRQNKIRLFLLGPLLAVLLAFCRSATSVAQPGELAVCLDIHEPATLDPFDVFAEKGYVALQQTLEGLVRFNPDGGIEPALALSWERINDRIMRFHLRRDVKFHNGEPFDSESVRLSVERYLDPHTRFPGLGFLGPLEKAVAIDRHTVDLVTRAPDGALLNRLAAFLYIVPARYYSNFKKEFGRKPIGTGPFVFESWQKDRGIYYKANLEYWRKGYPKFQKLSFRFLPIEKQVSALLSGEVDLLTDMPGTETETIAKSRVAAVIKKPTFYTVGAIFNTHEGPLKDRRVRLALNLGVDRQDLIRYDQLGNAAVIASLTMPGEIGHAEDLRPYDYDPAQAKRLLRQAGHPRLKLRALVKEQTRRTALILKKQWERIGVDLEIKWVSEVDALIQVQAQRPDIVIGGCPDPMAHSFFITSLFLYSKSPYSLTKNPQLDQMLEQALAQMDVKRMEEQMREVDRFVHREALSLFTYQKVKTYAVKNGVAFVPYVTGMPHLYMTGISTSAQGGQ